VRGQGTPGTTRLFEPEHGRDHLPEIRQRAALAAPWGGEQRGQPAPLCIRARARVDGGHGALRPGRQREERGARDGRLAPCPPCAVAALGGGLRAAAPV
jgi:hypothetical protein